MPRFMTKRWHIWKPSIIGERECESCSPIYWLVLIYQIITGLHTKSFYDFLYSFIRQFVTTCFATITVRR